MSAIDVKRGRAAGRELPVVTPPSRRAASALLCGLLVALFCLGGGLPVRAQPPIDFLTLPAFKTPKASRALLLALADAGGRLVAVGERGIVVYSDDQGVTWTQADVPVSVTLTAVTFPTPTEGWAVGHDGVILHSADRGQSWTLQFDGVRAAAAVQADAERRAALARAKAEAAAPGKARDSAAAALEQAETALDDALAGGRFGPSRPFLAVAFRDARTGIAVGSFGQIFQTRDGGQSWVYLGDRIDNPDRLHYGAVLFDETGAVLVAGEGGRITRSADGGDRWTVITLPERGMISGLRRVGNAVLAYGGGGRVYRLTGRDGVWSRVPTCSRKTLAASLVRGQTVLLFDAGGAVMVSGDGGTSWTCPPSADASLRPVAAAIAASDGKIVLAGPGGLRVTDGLSAR